jgi:hypothetical protein
LPGENLEVDYSDGGIDWDSANLDCLGTQLDPSWAIQNIQPSTFEYPNQGSSSNSMTLFHAINEANASTHNTPVMKESTQGMPPTFSIPAIQTNIRLQESSVSITAPMSRISSNSPAEGAASNSSNDSSTGISPIDSSVGSDLSVNKASAQKRPRTNEPEVDSDKSSIKRQRNTIASRKYRQKRLDRLADLEKRLDMMTSERDSLRIKLARREAEVDALRNILSTGR